MKFNSDDVLPLNKLIEILSMAIVVRAIPFLNECLYEICKWRVKMN